jgi:hypothetical protein
MLRVAHVLTILIAGLLAAPPVVAHDLIDAISRHRGYLQLDNDPSTSHEEFLFLCDKIYRIFDNPEDGGLGCVESVRSVPPDTPINQDATFPAVTVSLNTEFTQSLDCKIKLVNSPYAGTWRVRLTDGVATGACDDFPFATGQTVESEFDQDVHWSRTHNALTPALFKFPTSLRTTSIGFTSHLNYTTFGYYTGGGLPPASLGILRDAAKTNTYHSVDATNIHYWNITDPGGDDRLIVGGLDVTPPVGGTHNLDPAISVKRSDAGGGNVRWEIRSSLATEYVMVDIANNSPTSLDWNIRGITI